MPMTARSPHERHRTATALELFFDLVFVVAIAQAAEGLHHAIGAHHIVDGLIGFTMVFFAIWWAWLNFTWFASAYDCDDIPYRLAVFVQMTGALILAAGVATMLEELRPNAATVGGYVVMRLAMVAQWLRAGASDPARRRTAHRYATGIAVLQTAWVSLLFLPVPLLPSILGLGMAEMLVPVWAERAEPTTWHPHHIAERYALMTIIVLGESILAAVLAIQEALSTGETVGSLLPVIVGGLLTVYSLWWIYFDRPAHDLLTSMRRTFLWGYGHFLVFASAAAVGAGLAVAVEASSSQSVIGTTLAGFAVAVPVVIFLLSLWTIHYRPEHRRLFWLAPVTAPLILLAPLSGYGVLLIGLTLAGIVSLKIAMGPKPAHPEAA